MLKRYWNRVEDFHYDVLFPTSWLKSMWFALWSARDYDDE